MMPPEEHIPGKAAIIPYYIIASFSFVLTAALCIIAAPAFTGHYFQPKILAITHLAILGWGTMVIFGASNQLAPVIAEHKLHNERIPVIVLSMKVIGISLLVWSFWNFEFTWLGYTGGLFLLMAFVLHAYNLYRTVKGGTNNIINDFLITAHVWLVVTAILGLMLLVNMRHPFLPEEHLHYLKTHASIGMAGWFLQLVIGISSRLVPMFLLSRNEEKRWLYVTYYTINTALIFLLLESMIFSTTWGKPLSFAILGSGMISYAIYIRKCYTSAMRRSMDQGMKQTFLALFLIAIPFLLLLMILFAKGEIAPNLITAYGFSFFAGFISTLIMGQTFKTLPFIIWMHLTRPDQLPELLPKDLFREHWVKWQMFTYLPSFLIFLTGILLRQSLFIYVGASVMTIAAAFYFYHVLFIINKLRSI